MGRLPVQGVAWYRRTLTIAPGDQGKTMYLDIDGAMSYAMMWLNGKLVGGWPYGYNSFRLDLTPYLQLGDDNLLAIRLDNPVESSRWYPGGGIYRNVWLTKVGKTHVAQWGTHVTTKIVSAEAATVEMVVNVENKANGSQEVTVATDLHMIDPNIGLAGARVAQFTPTSMQVPKGQKDVTSSVVLQNPRLWGPPPTQTPNLYVAVTRLISNNQTIDTYETQFGIRSITYDGTKGPLLNGEHIRIQGVNQHHDLGALGTAFNYRAAVRQLEALREVGCNAIRMSHNPPAPELLALTDGMGFIVVDEIFDIWQRNKTTNDAHLIFDEWHEADLRNFLRRDRNHASVVAWSVGNEVGEQYTVEEGAAIAKELVGIAHEEDGTRGVTASMNYAKPDMPCKSIPREFDVLSLNYQGEGIRDAPAYAHLPGIKTPPLYPAFHATFPQKLLLSSETAAALSTRGTYIFPVTPGTSAPVNATSGGNATSHHVSAYELYSADFGSAPDKVFAAQDSNPFVAGEFVWSGWDYLGEPTPYYSSRSSYFGIIDLAGFKKDRFFLYQSRWRPGLRMAHILPHWTWPERVGLVTPVHVFSAASEAELFVHGKSLGRKKKMELEYRFRWDDVVYEPGEVRVVVYTANGTLWAEDAVRTAGSPFGLEVDVDRNVIAGDGNDLSFITVRVVDKDRVTVPQGDNKVRFEVEEAAAELVATDNGDPTDMTPFPEAERKAFNGLVLGIVRSKGGESGLVSVRVTVEGLESASLSVEVQ